VIRSEIIGLQAKDAVGEVIFATERLATASWAVSDKHRVLADRL
jgi:hypothetical protein